MTFEIHLPDSTYAEPSRRIAFHQRFADRVASIPGVQAAGAISWLPVSGPYNNWTFTYISAEGELLEHKGEAGFRVVAGRYFEAMNIPLAMGRRFERSDDGDSPLVAMISQSTARRYYEGRDPLIQDVIVDGRRWRIIGVVEDVAYDHRGTTENTIYLPHSQFGDDRNWALTQVISMSEPRSDLLQLVRGELAEIDPDLVVHNPRSMQEVMGRAIARDRFALLLMGLFAAVALTLAFVGIYGVLAYSVDQRAREIGVRMAMGATPWTVVREVIKKGMGWTAAGIVIGLVGAFALTRLLGSMLFGVTVTDGGTFVLVPFAVALVALLAGYVPARRAARVDPLEVLRHQ